MARNRNMIEIDSEKFRKEIYKKNRNLQSMSFELGYSRSYLSVAVKSGKIPMSVVKTLDAVYGIPQERYEIKEEKDPITEINGQEYRIDENALYELIKKAVYEGMKKAWEEV